MDQRCNDNFFQLSQVEHLISNFINILDVSEVVYIRLRAH